jgi:hypothetical protein
MKATQTHYDNGKNYDVIDIIRDYNVNFCRGNILKYVLRAGKKEAIGCGVVVSNHTAFNVKMEM